MRENSNTLLSRCSHKFSPVTSEVIYWESEDEVVGVSEVIYWESEDEVVGVFGTWN
ncbi:unnamed protein product [Acanthoscelides obtectus]|uniref:Uncharacterized protein n=1 Tax=Acanthoscelides obtectus TaxID=200917 RepID=A0A9P0JLD6_ACAOB|nr:unnamed protein product [Acanthoscelides obtectus]CAK1662091.1 hypothetical protein AOBTE_LOCUS22980 [Acanthoscelides obtectus]